MIKAVTLSLGLILLVDAGTRLPAQSNATDIAVNEAVLRQARTVELNQKLVDAKKAADSGDLRGAAKQYEDANQLVQEIGSGIDAQRAEMLSGLSKVWLTLARDAQRAGNYREADRAVMQVLNADPENPEAKAFKRQNDRLIESLKGRIPDNDTLDQIPQAVAQRQQAGTLVQDGRVFYEMGNLDAAEAKLEEAQKLDPQNPAALQYLLLIKQARYAGLAMKHAIDTQNRITQVEKQWVQPENHNLPLTSNPFATTNLIYTGPGREEIANKLQRIRLESVSYDGLPLSEVLHQLSEQTRLRDPEKKGINFIINPNPDNSGPPIASIGVGLQGQAGQAAAFGRGGRGGFGGGQAGGNTDPVTGLPLPDNSGGTSDQVDPNTVTIKLALNDVRLADLLDAIVTVADHPIKYSIEDYAIVFSSRGTEAPTLFSRVFKVDPNTFYSGLESVSSASFGQVYNTGGNGGAGGGSSGGAGGQNQNGAVVAVVNASPGAGGLRNTGTGGGGGGGGGAGTQGAVNPVGNFGGAGGLGGNANSALGGQGGLRYVTQPNLESDVSATAREFFTALGVNLDNPPGKACFFNEKSGLLFVKATQDDLDTIERAIQVLNQVAPQVHIKARFIEVQQTDNNQFGFDWYLGNFINGSVVANGGSAPSLNTPVSSANPLGTFPGNTTASQIAGAATDQQITSGLRNSGPAIATVTGILTDPNFRVVLHALEQRTGVENLAEPEVTTTSGRQTQMRATSIIYVLTGFNFQQGVGGVTGGTGTTGVP